MNQRPSAHRKPSCLRRLGCLAGGCGTVLLALLLGGVVLAAVVDGIVPGLVAAGGAPLTTRVKALGVIAVADLGETPHLTPQPPTGALPLCRNVSSVYDRAFRLAFGLMRGTDEGRRLYALLVDHGICVGVTDLPFNTAFSETRVVRGDWSGSTIMVDRRYVRSLGADVLAAVLVHEATHLDRAISGTACYLKTGPDGTDACTTLPNGVKVDEEVAAHTAEAQWWLAAYGDDGKRFAWRNDYAENRLLKAYLRGPASFRTFVTNMRSDPREGKGI